MIEAVKWVRNQRKQTSYVTSIEGPPEKAEPRNDVQPLLICDSQLISNEGFNASGTGALGNVVHDIKEEADLGTVTQNAQQEITCNEITRK